MTKPDPANEPHQSPARRVRRQALWRSNRARRRILRVHRHACFGLLGPNGAGKSTLIRSAVGQVRPNVGNIWVFGHPANSAAARAAMGWVPQNWRSTGSSLAVENLEAFGRYHGLRGKALREAIQWCLEWAGLADRAGATVKILSGDMRQRLNLAAGLIHRPRIVLLDEPTVGVDPQSRNRIFEMVAGLRQQGTTVIYTTHYMEEAERLCDRIAILDHGRVIAQGTKEELVARSLADAAMCSCVFLPLTRAWRNGHFHWLVRWRMASRVSP